MCDGRKFVTEYVDTICRMISTYVPLPSVACLHPYFDDVIAIAECNHTQYARSLYCGVTSTLLGCFSFNFRRTKSNFLQICMIIMYGLRKPTTGPRFLD
jgi:hypothetical protein